MPKTHLRAPLLVTLLIIPPIILASALASSGAFNNSDLAAYLITSWSIVILVILPLAFIATALEVLMQTIVKWKTTDAVKQGKD